MDAKIKKVLTIVVLTELAVFVGSRAIVANFNEWSWESETLRTILRIAASLIFWYFFKEIILAKKPRLSEANSATFAASMLFLFSVVVLVGNLHFVGETARVVFLTTSVFVAIHEEFLFRAIVQNHIFANRKPLVAITLTSAIMTVWHVGVVNPFFFAFAQIFIISFILGLIYEKSGSILLVIAIHTLYDAAWLLTPALTNPLWYDYGLIPLAISLVFALFWFYGRR